LKFDAGEGRGRSFASAMGKKGIKKFNEQENTLHKVIEGKLDGYIWRRNCLLNRVIEGEIVEKLEGMRRRGNTRKQLLDYLKKTGIYWNLEGEALHRSLWRAYFERD